MAGKRDRKEQMKATALYPLDWLEERSGLVGGVKYFLFRKVPGDINWMQTLGSATLTAFIVQAVTGVLLNMTAAQTATKLGIGTTSVITHRQRAYDRLGVSDMRQLFKLLCGA